MRPAFQRLGVRGHLLLAFFGISAFAVIAAAAAMYSFAEVGKVLGRITQESMPSALASLELSREAERVVTAAPALLAATTRTQHQEVSQAVATEVERLHELLEALQGSAIAPEALAAVEPAIDGLQANLTALDGLVAERKEQLLRSFSGTNIATQRLARRACWSWIPSSPSVGGRPAMPWSTRRPGVRPPASSPTRLRRSCSRRPVETWK